MNQYEREHTTDSTGKRWLSCVCHYPQCRESWVFVYVASNNDVISQACGYHGYEGPQSFAYEDFNGDYSRRPTATRDHTATPENLQRRPIACASCGIVGINMDRTRYLLDASARCASCRQSAAMEALAEQMRLQAERDAAAVKCAGCGATMAKAIHGGDCIHCQSLHASREALARFDDIRDELQLMRPVLEMIGDRQMIAKQKSESERRPRPVQQPAGPYPSLPRCLDCGALASTLVLGSGGLSACDDCAKARAKLTDESHAAQPHATRFDLDVAREAMGQAQPTTETTINHAPATTTGDTTKGSSIMSNIVREGQDAARRLAGSQFCKLTREPLIALLQRKAAPGDESMRVKIAEFFETDMGKAIYAMILSGGLTTLNGIGQGNEVSRMLETELRVSGMAGAGDVIADVLMGPLREVMATYLRGTQEISVQFPATLAEGISAAPLHIGVQATETVPR